jgi:hypothetical protein
VHRLLHPYATAVLVAASAGLVSVSLAASAAADPADPSSAASAATLIDDIGVYIGGSGGAAAESTSGAVSPIVTAYPLELLHDASANLTEANQVLSGAASEVAGMTQQTAAQNIALAEIASLYTAESSLSSYDNGAFADLLNPWFNVVDQGWNQGTEALLSADQAVAAAVTAGSGVESAVFAVFAPDFQLAGDMLNSFPIELLAGFTDPAALADLFLS